jgi:hypothetical protein
VHAVGRADVCVFLDHMVLQPFDGQATHNTGAAQQWRQVLVTCFVFVNVFVGSAGGGVADMHWHSPVDWVPHSSTALSRLQLCGVQH